jgi:steroid Delta-isomerase
MEPSDAAKQAMTSVEHGARDEWLALFSPDAVLEDPVGHVPPRRGAEQIAEFWDSGIAVLEQVRFDVKRVYDAPREALVLADVSIRAPGGAVATYDAALHYALDEAGAIASLRAFWDLPAVMRQLA